MSATVVASSFQYLVDGSTQTIYYQGQQVVITGLNSDTDYQLRSIDETTQAGAVTASTHEESFHTNSSGMFVVDTSTLDTDDYFVRGPGAPAEDESNAFELTTMSLSTSFAADSVNDASTLNLAFDSNRGTYDVNVTADGLDESDLAGIFTNHANVQTHSDGTVTLVGVNDGTLAADFNGVAAGNYTFNFESTDTTASSSDSVEVTQAAAANAEFTNNNNVDQRGDIVNVPVDLTSTTDATVVIGNAQESGYEATVEVTDVNGDGQVTLMWNSYAAGTGANVVTAAGDDTATLIGNENTGITGGPSDSIIAADSYDLEVWTGHGVNTANSPSTDLATLTVETRSTDGIKTWTAPASMAGTLTAGDLTVADVLATAEAGSLTQGSSIAEEDVYVTEIEASGLEGVAAVDGSLFADGDHSLTAEELGVSGNTVPETLDLTAANANIVSDGANDTYYVVWDTEDLEGQG
ncbi:hypothetical protein ACKVMT_14075, partial [Halobacteriales archaeon Cl-PHB]